MSTSWWGERRCSSICVSSTRLVRPRLNPSSCTCVPISDGLTLVMPLNSVYVDQLVGRKEVQFDLRKFHSIGSPAVESVIMYMRADLGRANARDASEQRLCRPVGGAKGGAVRSA